MWRSDVVHALLSDKIRLILLIKIYMTYNSNYIELRVYNLGNFQVNKFHVLNFVVRLTTKIN